MVGVLRAGIRAFEFVDAADGVSIGRVNTPPRPLPHLLPARASWIELDSAALRQNVALFRRLVGADVRLGAVLKGNAYGHGFEQVLPVVHPLADLLYVIDPEDALAVRRFEKRVGAVSRQVVVLGAVDAREAAECARADIDVTITDAGWAEHVPALRAASLQRPMSGHVHVDTGLGREGFTNEEIPSRTGFLREAADVIAVRGVLSHFANTEDVTEQTYAKRQLRLLNEATDALGRTLGRKDFERHVAASAAAMLLPSARLDAVRIGISLYGLWPSTETRLSASVVMVEPPKLQPVLSWRCRSQAVKSLPAGAYVGYGCSWRAPRASRVAVLPVGYFDGYPRLLSGRAHVLVNGQRCPVVGRVMMNHLIVDVTEAAPDEAEITATLLGADGEERLSAELLAGWAQTINYELVTRLGAHLRRIVV